MACEKAFLDRVMQRLEMRLLLQSSEQNQLTQTGAGIPVVEDEELCAAPPSPRLDQLSEPLAAVIANASREASSPSSGVEEGAEAEGHSGFEAKGLASGGADVIQRKALLSSDGIGVALEEGFKHPAGMAQVLTDVGGSDRLPHLPPVPVGGSSCGNGASAMELVWKLPAENVVPGNSLDVSAVHIGQFRWVVVVGVGEGADTELR